jgi:hypothetical protein
MKRNSLLTMVLKMLIIVFSFVLIFVTEEATAQTVTANTQSTNNGWFYSFWNDNSSGSASMTLGTGGSYSTTWSNVGNFTCGKGWSNGSATQVICFSGSFNGGNNGYLAIYGWTENALIEYYVVEDYGSWTPPGGTSLGTFTSDGGTYNIYQTTRTNQPSVIGTATFQQYWSVRTTKRSSGTVTFANHVAAWAAKGMNMGTKWDYQILETEGYQSSGSSSVTISSCTASVAPTVAFSAPANNATSCVGNTITITATPAISTGTISKVDFYDGTTLLGTASTSPYTYSWTSASAGTHTIGVIATSAAAVASSQTTETITVNALPAAPTVTTPVSFCQGATATTLTATGTALKWYTAATGGTALTAAPTPSTTATGTTNYYVSQTVNTCEGTRATIASTVNAVPAAPTVTTPVNYTQGATATALTATGTALKWYTVATGGTALTAAPTPSTTATGTTNYYVSQTTNTCEGNRATLAVVIAAAGNIPPTVSITAPANNANLTTGSITITATAADADGTVSKVDFYNGTTLLGSSTTAPYSFTWTAVAVGTYSLTAKATDNKAAVTTSSTIAITVIAPVQTKALSIGWNLIGCPLTGSTSLQSALSSIWSNVATVKNLDSFYSSANQPALNSLLNVQWGQGYMINVTAPCTLDWIAR